MNIFRSASGSSLSSQSSSIGDLSSIVPDQEPPRIGTRFSYRVGGRTIELDEDTAGGCGGKAWEAAIFMCDYLQHKCSSSPGEMAGYRTVLELGSGTGFVGIVAASLGGTGAAWEPQVTITDLDIFVPLVEHNVRLNLDPAEADRVTAAPLHWGEPLPAAIRSRLPFDLILLSDCIYLESLFDILVDTLCDLTDPVAEEAANGRSSRSGTEIWIAYKKRRKADKRFWAKLGKKFEYREVEPFPGMDAFRKDSLFLYRVRRKAGVGRAAADGTG
ncbi:putative methyltransferase-domain-containing protein [Hyaloraphidium curvatum]|nr:putative methyltransferase-domain-containing protein [Hyaloraphidium curvatum]